MVRCEQNRDNFDMAAIYEQQRQQLVENMKIRYGQRVVDEKAHRSILPFGRGRRGM